MWVASSLYCAIIRRMLRSVTIKRSPAVILKDLIFLEALAAIAFFVAKILADYGEIYERLGFFNVISYNIAQTLFLFFGEAVIIGYVFFRWHVERVVISQDKVSYARGLFWRQESSILRAQITSSSFKQSPLDKLIGSGTITIRGNGGEVLIISDIAEPDDFVAKLEGRKVFPVGGFAVVAPVHLPLAQLISNPESDELEFKATLRWDIRAGKVSKAVEKAVMKTIVAFMNSRGGTLVIGVDDGQSVVGLEHDYATLGRPNADGFENHFSHVFQNMIGAHFRHLARLYYENHEGKECCLVRVMPSDKPVYLKSDDREEFYIRTGNGTTALKFSEAASYITSRFT